MNRIHNCNRTYAPFLNRPFITFILLIIAYIAIVLLHISLLYPYFHPGIGVYFVPDGSRIIGSFIGDEAMYRLYAEALLHAKLYPANPLYPPAYPLLLALAELLSQADPIKSMIIFNIAVASAAMFPVYALARQILARDLAFGASIVAGVLPASFIFAPALMSENLSTTLFATAFWLAVRQRPANLVVAGIFGFVITLCFLSKFVFLTTIPFLGIAFLINQWQMATPLFRYQLRIQRIARLAIVTTICGVIPASLWSAYLVASGGTVAQSLGMHIGMIGVKVSTPSLTFIPNIFALHGLAIFTIVLPILPAVLVTILSKQHIPIRIYVALLGVMTAFMWLFISWYSWTSFAIFSFPQPVCERYFMMLVPVYVPLAFAGIKLILDRIAKWQSWLTLAAACAFSVALAILVQLVLYNQIIWTFPTWTTTTWVGGPDILYGGLGFPVITVTTVAAATLIALKLINEYSLKLDLIKQQILRVSIIVIATASLVVFNIASSLVGINFAWNNSYIATNSAHASAITTIIGDRSKDSRPVFVRLDPTVIHSIETNTGIHLEDESRWWVNMQYWTGRQAISETDRKNYPSYLVTLASHDADPATTYQVGNQNFQVKTLSN